MLNAITNTAHIGYANKHSVSLQPSTNVSTLWYRPWL